MLFSCFGNATNYLIPQDAFLLKKMYAFCGEQSQKQGWKAIPSSVIATRLIVAPCTIPVAAVEAVGFGFRGLCRFGVGITDLDLKNAFLNLGKDLLSGIECLALFVTNIAFAALGLFAGSYLFRYCIPKEEPKVNNEDVNLNKGDSEQFDSESESLKEEAHKKEVSKLNETMQQQQKLLIEKQSAFEQLKKDKDRSEKKFQTKLDEQQAITTILKNMIVERDQSLLKADKEKASLEKEIVKLKKQTELLEKSKIDTLTDFKGKMGKLNEELEKRSEEIRMFEMENARLRGIVELLPSEDKPEKKSEESAVSPIASSHSAILAIPPSSSPSTISSKDSRSSSPLKSTSPAEEESHSPSSPSWGFGWATSTAKWASEATSYITSQVLYDGNDPWKQQRYAVEIEQLIKSFSETRLANLKNNISKLEGGLSFAAHLTTAIEILMTPREDKNHRDQYHAFKHELRIALNALENKESSSISHDIQTEVFALCEAWYTSVALLPFNSELVNYVATEGDETKAPDASIPMHKRFKELLEGIHKADQKYKAPLIHLNAAKAATVFESYDPSVTNAPNQWAVMQYQDGEGKSFETVHARIGVPVVPRPVERTGQPHKSWEYQGISISPEYLAFLRSAKAKGEKVLSIMHLNPHYFNTETGELKAFAWGDYTKLPAFQKYREAVWIKLMLQLSNDPEFKDTFKVALLPMDGDWLKKDIEKCTKPKETEAFSDWFADVISQRGSHFILPEEIKDKKAFVKELADKVKGEYFIGYSELTKEQQLAFYGLWCSKAAEKLQLMLKARYQVRHCKDGVDRTMSLVGAELCEKTSRLERSSERKWGRLDEPEIQSDIIGTTLAPALAILKRELLEERQPVLLATVEHLENLKEVGKTLDAHEGYRLVNITLNKDLSQALHPTEAIALTV